MSSHVRTLNLDLSYCLDSISKLPGKVSIEYPGNIWDELSLFQTDSILITGEASLVINHYRNCRYCWPMDCGCF